MTEATVGSLTAETQAWLDAMPARGLAETLGIRLVSVERDRVVATMAVESRVHQPYGVLHGGASVALAETVASIAAALQLDRTQQMAVGLEINANHLRPVREGLVTAVGTPVHIGRTTQVWEVRISDPQGRPVCISRCTLAVVPLAGASPASAPPASAPPA